MARKTTSSKSRSQGSQKNALSELSWEDFRPEWVNDQLERISSELEKWGDDMQSRVDKFRAESQKRIEKRVKQVQKELRKLPAIKRAEELRAKVGKQVEKNIDAGVDRVYSSLKLARLDEVKRLERKVAQLNKKLRVLEKQQAAA